jgi:hypothetical protein
MVKCIYLTLITSILLFPLSEAPAQTRTWHDTGGCGGHKLGECWPLPGPSKRLRPTGDFVLYSDERAPAAVALWEYPASQEKADTC